MNFIPGTNYYAKLDDNIQIALTNSSGYAMYGKCTGNPSIVALQVGVYATGCQMVREDILSGDNVYSMTGTTASPAWTLNTGGGGGADVVFGEVVSGSGTTWTLANVPTGTISLAANGQTLLLTEDYTIVGDTITTVSSWSAGTVIASYQF